VRIRNGKKPGEEVSGRGTGWVSQPAEERTSLHRVLERREATGSVPAGTLRVGLGEGISYAPKGLWESASLEGLGCPEGNPSWRKTA